eukprot:TRINITY_DN981_c0_g1_i11.p2 TRINITY_DN981_c0_g1~~TRINITY_DN981_c0_g1_i11.p2  ORF type:complete len:103 (-),score=29.33 TRINITY_DN981_c0_g1_i11:73-381(-)
MCIRDSYYGDHDYMDWTSAQRLALQNPGQIFFEFVKDSTHHINMENAKDLTASIINHIVEKKSQILMKEDLIIEDDDNKSIKIEDEEDDGIRKRFSSLNNIL